MWKVDEACNAFDGERGRAALLLTLGRSSPARCFFAGFVLGFSKPTFCTIALKETRLGGAHRVIVVVVWS